MKKPWTMLLIGALPLLMAGSHARSEGEPRIDTLKMGTYWYGAEITKKDLLGKVVLVEIWGS